MKREGQENRFKKGFRVSPRVILLAIITLLLIGALSLRISYNHYSHHADEHAILLAESVGAFLSADQISGLEASPNDVDKPEYQQIKNSLIQLKKLNEDIVFAYIYTQKKGKIYFLADSEIPGSGGYSPPGQEYSEATKTTKQPFEDGESILTKPAKDRWGTWVSSLVPVTDLRTGTIIAVLGIDYNSQQWWGDAFVYALKTTTIVICIYLLLISLSCMAAILSNLLATSKKLKESERSKSVILANLPGLAYKCNYDRDWTMQFVSEGCFALTGYNPESLLYNRELSYNHIISPEYRDIIWNEWDRIIHEKKVFKHEYPIITASGEDKWVYEQGQPIYSENGEILCLEGLLIDITDKKIAQDEREKLFEQTQAMFNEHDAVMILIELETGAFLDANPSAFEFYGYSRNELLTMKIQDINLLPAEEVNALSAKAAAKKQKYFAFPHRLKNGEIKIVDVYTSPISYQGKKVLYSIIIDATEREAAYAQIEYLDRHDYLTGAYNRKYFEETKNQLDREDCLPLSIIIGDINGTRFINDTFGNAAGDKLIAETARLLRDCIRENDFLARTGGDEFCILMPNTDQNTASSILNKITDAFETYNLSLTDPSKHISFSLGFGTKQTPTDRIMDVEKEADEYLQKRKLLESTSHHNAVITSLLATVYIRSQETESHCKRISSLSKIMGEKLGLPPWDRDNLQLFSLLHDIGKVGVEDSVLNKPGKLTDEEWVLMKKHSEIGYRIAKSTPGLESVAEHILFHHERWDGKGYPQGLSGENIPLLSRILAIADAYDAMTSDRIYRKALGMEKAITEIEKNAGTQFDPLLVEVFVNQVLEEESYILSNS